MLRYMMWTGSGGAAMKIAVLVTTWAATRALAPAAFGHYVALQATALFGAALWDFGISVLMTRELSAGRISPGVAVRQALGARLRTLPIWGGVLLAGYVLFAPSVPKPALALFVGVSFFSSLNTLTLAGLRGAFQFRSVTFAGTAGRTLTALSSILVIALVPAAHDSLALLAGCLMAGEIAILLQSGLMWHSAARFVRTVASSESSRLSTRAAAPFAANGMLTLAYNRLDVLIVAGLTSGAQLGAYAIASRAQDVLYLVPSSVGSVAMPALSRRWNSNSRGEIAKVTGKLVGFGFAAGLCISALVFAFAPMFIHLVLGPSYAGAVGPLRIICWFLPLAMIQAPLISALAASDRAIDTTKIFLVTLIVACLCHLALDWWAGAQGAALASLIRDAVAAPLAVLLSLRYGLLRLNLGERPISLVGTPNEAPTSR